MNKRNVGLVVILVLLGGVFAFLQWRGRESPLMVRANQIGTGPVVFTFNDEVLFEEVMVIKPATEAPEGDGVYVAPEDEVLWHLIPSEPKEGEEPREPRPQVSIRYGSGVRGLRRAEGIPRDAAPLQPGTRYLFQARIVGEPPIELEFSPRG